MRDHLRSTDQVDISPTGSTAMQRAAMAACVIGIVLDELVVQNDRSNLAWCHHPVRSRHLANGMGKKEDALSSGASCVFKDFL